MRDQPQRLPEQRLHGVRRLVALDLGVPRQRADPDRAVLDPDVRQLGEPVDVDQVRRGGQPHVEHRQQALAAGEHLAVVTDLAPAPTSASSSDAGAD